MAQYSTDERLATLEEQVALLLRFKQEQEVFNQEQETHDIALLARVDSIGNDLRRVERSQIRGFEELRASHEQLRAGHEQLRAGHEQLRAEVRAGHEYLTARLDTVEDDLTKVVEMGVKHREAIDMLLEGQQAHAEAITSLQKSQQELLAGQQQIIEMLMGKPRRND